MAHSTQNTLDADAVRLIRYLQRGGTKSYYLTFDADGHATTSWYDSHAEPPAVPTGTNVYFGVNPCTAIPETNAHGKPAKPENVRGRVENIAALNCLYAEFDAKDFGGSLDETLAHVRGLAVQPSVIVASGGGYHCYWLLAAPFVLDTPEKRARAVNVQARWQAFVRGDKAAKDIARVLRVPGTLNYKYEPARPVTFVEQDYRRTYTLDALQATLPAVAPRTARTPKPDAPACQADSLEPSVDLATIGKAVDALRRLRTERRDDYDDWLHVGMALRELGAIGYELWLAFSAPSPKFDIGVCQDKWQTFKPGGECSGYTLASLYAWARDDAGELASSLDDAERLQLQNYQARDVQTQRIMAMDAPMSAKGVIVGSLPAIEAGHVLVVNKDGHSGSVAVNYGNIAAILNTSKATVARAIDIGEQAGLWRKDAEHKQTQSGYDVLAMRLDLQPAYFDAALAAPIEHKPRGGKRAGAGRKPKCATCPPGTPMRETTETTIKTFCHGCGDLLDEVTTYSTRELMPDAPAEFKHETGYVTPAGYEPESHKVECLPCDAGEQAAEFKHETVVVPAPPPWCLPETVLKKTCAELVPVALTETYDTAAALRLADTYAPDDAAERLAYKTALTWLQRGEHEKAAALAANVHDERAHAALLHLAERPPTLAPV